MRISRPTVDPFDASAAFVAETIGLLREHKPGLASAVRSLCSDIESGSSRPVLAASVAQGLHADLSGCLDRLRLLPSAAGSADEQQLSAALAAVALLGAAAFSRGGRLEDGSALLDAALLRSRAAAHSAALQRVLSLVSLTLTTGPHPGTSSPPATEPPPSTRGWGVPPPPTGEMSGADLRAFVSAVCALSCPRLAPRLAAAWPAVRRWSEPNYLRARHGHRLVPVEVGAEHIGERALHGVGEQQVVCTLEAFIDDVILAGHAATRRGGLPTAVSPTVPVTSSCTRGYLAQHTLFEQIPSLRDDLGTPPAVPPSADLRAWFGPAGVATPVHHDLHHGLLVQLVGRKRVQLWPPAARGLLRAPPLGSPLANTSPFDPGLLESPPADGAWTTEEVEQLRQAASLHTLEPGDALLIPQGWWHSAQALTVSFSVSFWWNDEAGAGSARGGAGLAGGT
mmetsp:Transcript_27016/g.89895  ORF Transcript_27016/g.89895 Transcript_27016/m.89895 type:complete len:453 (+) Transcript_27016:71-1429(+)